MSKVEIVKIQFLAGSAFPFQPVQANTGNTMPNYSSCRVKKTDMFVDFLSIPQGPKAAEGQRSKSGAKLRFRGR